VGVGVGEAVGVGLVTGVGVAVGDGVGVGVTLLTGFCVLENSTYAAIDTRRIMIIPVAK
jgi:hypothetical protein